MTQLSENAKNALINASKRGQGATLPKGTTNEVRAELRAAGLVEATGLTRRGSIAQERAFSAMLDALL
jgi:hypothetical protein